jgi:hypothetical protein
MNEKNCVIVRREPRRERGREFTRANENEVIVPRDS